jgi:hydroxypyruvate reductase
MNNPRLFLQRLFEAAVANAQPGRALMNALPSPPPGRTLVLGAGKAAAVMAHVVEACWPPDADLSGLAVTRYGHAPARPLGVAARIEIVEAAHPVPDAAGETAARRMLELTEGLIADDLVLCLLSGGASSLLVQPGYGLTLEDKQRITHVLLMSGAGIQEINCVRKHLSRVKGGRLAAACAPARVVTLAVSDVPGDDISLIGSGPTVADASTCAQALEILDRYRIALPTGARAALESGAAETPKPGDVSLLRAEARLIVTPRAALEAAAACARHAGIEAHILSDEIEGESNEVGKVHAALARAVARHDAPLRRPCVLLSGGETSVTVRPCAEGQRRGRGGRAGEFCLGLAHALRGMPGIWALAADTDGIDGSEDNAGAFVTPDTLARGRGLGLRVPEHLARNDSYGYFAALGDLYFTGPTHTNVNDFRAVLIL